VSGKKPREPADMEQRFVIFLLRNGRRYRLPMIIGVSIVAREEKAS
jgi:hypothetical protein